MSFVWNQDAVLEVAKFLKDGMSAKQIGQQLGISRNAVIGKVGREQTLRKIGFGWNKAHPFVGKQQARHKSVRSRDKRRARSKSMRQRAKKLEPSLVEAQSMNEVFQVIGRPLLMLKANDCRWPVNDAHPHEPHLFCGVDAGVGEHYCRHHKTDYRRNVAHDVRSQRRGKIHRNRVIAP